MKLCRVCCRCHTKTPTINMLMREHTTASGKTRNLYYCPMCFTRAHAACWSCGRIESILRGGTMQVYSIASWADHRHAIAGTATVWHQLNEARSRFDASAAGRGAAAARRTAAWTAIHNRAASSSRDSVTLCLHCRPLYAQPCAACHYNMLPASNGACPDVCTSCTSRANRKCIKCAKPCEGSVGNAVNRFRTSDGFVCSGCRRTPNAVDKNNKVNKSERSVGFELEYICDTALEENITQLYKWGVVKSDGSVRPRPEDQKPHRQWEGREFNSYPFRGDKLIEAIHSSCDIIKSRVAGYTNGTCGTHMHFGNRDMSKDVIWNVAKWWAFFEPVFMLMVDPSRRTNSYCKAGISWDDRYRAMNLTSGHGTVEIRLHHGSLDPDELAGWALTIIPFLDTFKNVDARVLAGAGSLSTRQLMMFLFQMVPLPYKLRKHLVARLYKHNPKNIKTLMEKTTAKSLPLETLVRAAKSGKPYPAQAVAVPQAVSAVAASTAAIRGGQLHQWMLDSLYNQQSALRIVPGVPGNLPLTRSRRAPINIATPPSYYTRPNR